MKFRFIYIFLILCLYVAGFAPLYANASAQQTWRIRLHEAAVVPTGMVRLQDIGEVHGTPPAGVWEQLSARPLWPAPPEPGKPLQITKNRLTQALRETLGTYADLCIVPSSMVIQRGGAVLREEDLRSLVVKTLTPEMRLLHGEAELLEFRLPPYVFLEHQGQRVILDPVKLEPGRVALRFVIQEVDGSDIRRFTGSATLNLWASVPSAAQPLNRGDALTADSVTWQRRNLAQLRRELWDGKGGPWQVTRSIGTGQPIYTSDITALDMVKKGDIVDLIYRRGNVELKVLAEVLADGGPGDTILVRNLQSKKQIYAVVRSSGVVETK